MHIKVLHYDYIEILLDGKYSNLVCILCYNSFVSNLIFGNAKVTHHCRREAETGFEAVATDIITTPGNRTAATILVQSCIEVCKSVCPNDCELKKLSGLSDEQLQDLLRMSQT